MEGYHFCAGASQRVHVLLNRNELHTQRGIHDLKKTAYLQVVSAETGEVFHNNRADLPGLDQCLHFLETRTLEGSAADAVVVEEHGMQLCIVNFCILPVHRSVYPCGKIREKLKQQALQIADEFVDYSASRSPKDIDRAYSNKASVYKVFGGDDAERSLLKKGYSSVESAPQCALGIADNLFECGQYNDALPYIEKCMIAVNKPQPDINPAYVHLIYALSKTQQLMDKEPLSDYFERRGEIEDIYKHFHIATDAFGSQENFLDVAKQTIKAITIQTGIEDTTNTSDVYI